MKIPNLFTEKQEPYEEKKHATLHSHNTNNMHEPAEVLSVVKI
jgi:hypothetical protein